MANPTEAERQAKTVAMGVLQALRGGHASAEGAVDRSGLGSIVVNNEKISVVDGRLQGQSQRDEIEARRQAAKQERREGIRLKAQSLLDRGFKFDSIELHGVTFEVADGIAVAVTE